jgi:hypothetical protein
MSFGIGTSLLQRGCGRLDMPCVCTGHAAADPPPTTGWRRRNISGALQEFIRSYDLSVISVMEVAGCRGKSYVLTYIQHVRQHYVTNVVTVSTR